MVERRRKPALRLYSWEVSATAFADLTSGAQQSLSFFRTKTFDPGAFYDFAGFVVSHALREAVAAQANLDKALRLRALRTGIEEVIGQGEAFANALEALEPTDYALLREADADVSEKFYPNATIENGLRGVPIDVLANVIWERCVALKQLADALDAPVRRGRPRNNVAWFEVAANQLVEAWTAKMGCVSQLAPSDGLADHGLTGFMATALPLFSQKPELADEEHGIFSAALAVNGDAAEAHRVSLTIRENAGAIRQATTGAIRAARSRLRD